MCSSKVDHKHMEILHLCKTRCNNIGECRFPLQTLKAQGTFYSFGRNIDTTTSSGEGLTSLLWRQMAVIGHIFFCY